MNDGGGEGEEDASVEARPESGDPGKPEAETSESGAAAVDISASAHVVADIGDGGELV